MALERIANADDPRVADYRAVSEPELARAHGLFVAEGRLVVERVIDNPRFRLRSVLVTDAARRGLGAALDRIGDRGTPVYLCEADDLLPITGHDMHRGCLALVERPAPLDLEPVLEAARRVVVLESVSNADNVGGVFRNAAAFAVDAVLLSPACCDPLYRKAIRTSMASTLRVPYAPLDPWPDRLTALHRAGFLLVALSPREPSETIDAFVVRPRTERLALLVGAEGAGLSPAVEAAADHRVRIPIRPGVDSLNLAVATGIALARLCE